MCSAARYRSPNSMPIAGIILVTGIQQGAPNDISRIRYQIGENGALGAAKSLPAAISPVSHPPAA